MAELTPAAERIAALKADGWTYADIGRALGINGSLVRQAISPSPGAKQKPLTKYVGALGSLQGKKPGAKPGALPGKRTTKAGKVAGVRKGVKTVTTKKGAQHTVVNVKKGPATLKTSLRDAARDNKRVRWDIRCKKVKTKSDDKGHEGWISGHLPSGWTVQTLADRIQNPQSGDSWKPGDVNGALVALAVEQNSGAVTSASGPQEYNLFTTDN